MLATDSQKGKSDKKKKKKKKNAEAKKSKSSFTNDVKTFQEPESHTSPAVHQDTQQKKRKRSKSLVAWDLNEPNDIESLGLSVAHNHATELKKGLKRSKSFSAEDVELPKSCDGETLADHGGPEKKKPFRPVRSTPTRIEPPVVPGQPNQGKSNYSGARKTPFNPFFGLQKFSVQNPEPIYSLPTQLVAATKASELNPNQIRTASTRNAGENNESGSRDAKRAATARGRIAKHDKNDTDSPTPLPKKEQKKRGRPKKIKEPTAAQMSMPATARTLVSTTSAQASGTLPQLTTPLAALLGSGERAEQLIKKLEQDKQMLDLEAEAWRKAMKF